MESQDDSPEAKAFRQYFPRLVDTIQDPESFADNLFSRNVIGRGLLQEVVQLGTLTKPQKSRKLLMAVHDQLMLDSSKITKVMEALSVDSSLKVVVDDLQKALLAAVGNPNLDDLVHELKDVYGWFQLGLCLDLPQDTLESIYVDYRDSHNAEGKCKTKMLSTWIESAQQPTWSTMVTALCATRKPATANKLAAKLVSVPVPTEAMASCGDELTSENEIPSQIMGLITTPEQEERVRELRDEVDKKDRELYEVNESITQCDREWNMLSTDLLSMKEKQQFNKSYIFLLLEDNQKQKVKLLYRRDELQDVVKKQAQQRPDISDSDMDHQREHLLQKQKEIDAVQHEIDRLQVKIESARKDSLVVNEQLQTIASKYDAICRKRKELQSHKMELLASLKKCEEDIDSCLLIKSTTTPTIPHQAKAKTAYYNIMLCGSRIEVKLRQSEIEQYESKIAEKETEVKILHEKLMEQQRQREQLEQHLRKSRTDKSSPGYDYAYAHAQYKREMEKYEMEQKLSDLWTENLEYKMKLDVVESQKHFLTVNLEKFMQELRSLESIQSKYQKQFEIKKRHPSEKLPCHASKDYQEIEEGANRSSTGVRPGSPEYVPSYFSGQVGHPTLDFSEPSTTRTERPTEPEMTTAHEYSTRSATFPHSPPSSTLARSVMSEEELIEQDWYQDISYEETEERLQKCNKDGVYLVRPSGSSPSKLALSYYYRGQVFNVRVQLTSVGKYHLGTDRAFDSIHELLEYYKKVSFNVFHGSVCQPGTTLTDICS